MYLSIPLSIHLIFLTHFKVVCCCHQCISPPNTSACKSLTRGQYCVWLFFRRKITYTEICKSYMYHSMSVFIHANTCVTQTPIKIRNISNTPESSFMFLLNQSLPQKLKKQPLTWFIFFTIDSLPVMEHVNGTGQNRDFCLCLLLLGKMCRDLFVVCIRWGFRGMKMVLEAVYP